MTNGQMVVISESRFIELVDAERKLNGIKIAELEKEGYEIKELQNSRNGLIDYAKELVIERDQLRVEVGRLRKGRDDRQAERDKEREKVRKLKEEVARLKLQMSDDDIHGDLMRATVGEFRKLRSLHDLFKNYLEFIETEITGVRSLNLNMMHANIKRHTETCRIAYNNYMSKEE